MAVCKRVHPDMQHLQYVMHHMTFPLKLVLFLQGMVLSASLMLWKVQKHYVR